MVPARAPPAAVGDQLDRGQCQPRSGPWVALQYPLAIRFEERLQRQHPRVLVKLRPGRPADSDGEAHMRYPRQVRAQFEHCRDRAQMDAERTAVTVSGSDVILRRAAFRSPEPEG
jgi:hypothetical protein